MFDNYREAIMNTVCVHCLERTGQGVCGIGGSDECALIRFLPEVVGIVKTIDSTVMHDYVHELHNVVCVSCTENEDGSCAKRGTSGCPLDLYYPLIVNTIKEVQAKEAA
ncbi:MAG TPA: hypothetical protein VII11_11275 [Bacteroidota bacterium]